MFIPLKSSATLVSPCCSGVLAIVSSVPTPSSPAGSTSVEAVGWSLRKIVSTPVNLPWLLKRIELRLPVTIASFVNALRFATRRMIRKEAMSYIRS